MCRSIASGFFILSNHDPFIADRVIVCFSGSVERIVSPLSCCPPAFRGPRSGQLFCSNVKHMLIFEHKYNIRHLCFSQYSIFEDIV